MKINNKNKILDFKENVPCKIFNILCFNDNVNLGLIKAAFDCVYQNEVSHENYFKKPISKSTLRFIVKNAHESPILYYNVCDKFACRRINAIVIIELNSNKRDSDREPPHYEPVQRSTVQVAYHARCCFKNYAQLRSTSK